ncbi:MAG: hypothetical protein JSS02_11775 [Planctomycetes bacterium]|nr:hypothetical protein [Planctomycetota bacterium]
MSKHIAAPRLVPVVCGLLCALWLSACSARGELDALEADLRSKEQSLVEMQNQLARTEDDLKIARRDAAALRTELAREQATPIPVEQAEVFYKVEGIKFHSLLTSGQSRDGNPGDEGISVLLMPVDVHGELVKLAGDVELELFDMSLPAAEQRLGTWKYSTDDVREHWHKGIVGTGYLFQENWQKAPVARELTLHARFRIPDGRKFDATTQLKVIPPGSPDKVADEAPGRPQAASSRANGETGVPARVMRPASASSVSATPDRAGKKRNGSATKTKGPPDAEQPLQTSDSWTEESIPTLR